MEVPFYYFAMQIHVRDLNPSYVREIHLIMQLHHPP